MAMSMDAVLKIKAAVTGDGAIAKMASGLGGLASQAGKAQKGLKAMAGAGGGLGAMLGTLAPALSLSGMGALAMNSVKASASMYDLSVKTGVSVEMLAKYRKAAGQSGTTIDAVGSGLLKLTKVMAMAADKTGSAGRSMADAAVTALKAVERGEVTQTKLVEQNTNQRIRSIDRETDRKLSSIEKKYRREEQRLRDIIDGTSQAEILKREQEDAAFAAIDARRQAEIDKVKADAAAKTQVVNDSSAQQLAIIKDLAAATRDAVKKDAGGDSMADQFEEMGLSGKGAAAVFMGLGIRVTDLQGNLRNTGDVFNELGGKIKAMPDGADKIAILGQVIRGIGPEFAAMFNKFGDFSNVTAALTSEQAKAAKDYELKIKETSAAIGGIGASLGMALLPALKSVADGLAWFIKGFTSLPAPIQQVAGTITLLALAFTALAPALVAAGTLLAPLIEGVAFIAAAITSLGGIVSVLGMVGASLAALVTWPVLIAAGIVAAVAVIFTFREQIGAFFTWLGGLWVQSMTTLGQIGYTLFLEPWVRMWNLLKAPAVSIFNSIVNTVKIALNALITFWGNVVNGIIRIANNAISGFNRISPIKVRLIPEMTVPRFAQGGFVTGPTLAMIGDNGSGQEYAVPSEKAVGFANNILAGRRGAAAIPGSGSSGGGGGSGPITVAISLTTGPVMEHQGQRYVTLEDAQRIARATANQAVMQLRTPGGRRAAGIR